MSPMAGVKSKVRGEMKSFLETGFPLPPVNIHHSICLANTTRGPVVSPECCAELPR